MAVTLKIPDRLIRVLRSAESEDSTHFPPTEVFNEGWMLRLVLDAMRTVESKSVPLHVEPGATWYSEALLVSPFAARQRADSLAEGFTNADGVIGHFAFRPTTRAGLQLAPNATQFVVIESKMFSGLSPGIKNAPSYNQAARNVACMAEAIARAGRSPDGFSSIGFFVAAPMAPKRRSVTPSLEALLEPDAIRAAVRQRIGSYEGANRKEAESLQAWEAEYFLPLVKCLTDQDRLKVLTWESCIDAIAVVDKEAGEELNCFYECCLSFGGLSTGPQ